jgi:DNA-binding transcriptional regulator YiaG
MAQTKKKKTTTAKRRPPRQTFIGQRLIAGMTEIHDALADGVDLRERFTVREVEVARPGTYSLADVRRVRQSLNMSQSVFAAALGVSVMLVRAWESGAREVSPLAGRLLDLVTTDPTAFAARVVRRTGATRPAKAG